MSHYGLHTTLPYEEYHKFVETVPPPKRDLDFFKAIPWARHYFTDDNGNTSYRPVPLYSRYAKPDTNDTFFSRTIANDDVIPHLLMLYRNGGWGNVTSDVPSDNKQRPFSAPPAPDAVLLFDLKDGMNGFAHTAHGGAMCAMLDEALGMTVEMHRQTLSSMDGTLMYTAGLNVSYLAPVPTPSVLAVRTWFLKREGRKWYLRAQVVDGGSKVLMEADSIWITSKPQASL